MKPGKLFKAAGIAFVFAAGICGYFFGRAQLLEYRFRQIHPDESEVQLLKIAGEPTEKRDCNDDRFISMNSEGRSRCAYVYWYKPNFFSEGWLVPIDKAGAIMQINRQALP